MARPYSSSIKFGKITNNVFIISFIHEQEKRRISRHNVAEIVVNPACDPSRAKCKPNILYLNLKVPGGRERKLLKK
jgi:hypothetical protein